MRRIFLLSLCAAAAALAFTLLATHTARAAWTHDPASIGQKFTTRSAYYPTACGDGSGGTFVAYLDLSTQRVWVQHMDASGNPLWGNDGVQAGANVAWSPESVVPDGSGGCIVSWFYWFSNNEDIYAQRLNSSGAQVWTAGGVLVCGAANNQQYSVLCPDGIGGAYVAWLDYRNNASVTDIYAQYLNPSGVAQWATNGIAVCTAADDQSKLSAAPDGSGGAFLCWQDSRSGVYKTIYAQHYNSGASGSWGANGLALTTGINADEWTPVIIPDGRTGAIIAWNDWRNGNSDVFAQRITSAGSMLWTANGAPLEAASGDQTTPVLASDGANGAVVAWVDGRSGTNNDVYAQRINALGVTQWATNGVPLCTAGGSQAGLQGVGDGSGGGIFTWYDRRNGIDDDVYIQHVSSAGSVNWTADGVAVNTLVGTQMNVSLSTDAAGGALVSYQSPASLGCVARVDRYGMLGGAAPTIVAVDDVPNDQGGYVSIRWTKSWLDAMPGDPISQYWIWRQVPQVLAQTRLAEGSGRLLEPGATPGPGTLRTTSSLATTYYWEYLGYVSAQGQAGYSIVEPTRGDSVAGSNPLTYFMVEARWSAVTGEYWDSDPVGSYSVDNLAPATPTQFVGNYSLGTATLAWAANAESDFAGYRLYRGTSATFTPSAATRVATPTSNAFEDAAGATCFYKLSAVDVHGNESGFATLLPAGTAGVGDDAFALAFAAPAPNPARGRCALAFTLPAAGAVRVGLLDVAGRRVATLAAGEFAAGQHHVEAALDSALPAGLYLVRFEAAGRAFTRRLVIAR